jgi:hypothetical protein
MHIIIIYTKLAYVNMIVNEGFDFLQKKFPKGKIWILYNV